MRGPPDGTVTLLFSDMESSTALLQEVGDERYGPILEQQRTLIRGAVETYDGYEVSCEGDAFFAAFGSANAAVEAAAASQRALKMAEWPCGGVRVRMGLHTGTPRVAGRDYLGADVHRAARVMDAAHGGQVLLTESTLAGVDGVSVRDLGLHLPKDFSVPERLFQLEAEGLDDRFPPPRTVGRRPTNLPPRPRLLVGREAEVEEVVALLVSGERLVTVRGTGGLGKTSFALEVARRSMEAFPDGVYLVELAAVVDPSIVVAEIARAIGLLDRSEEALARYLAQKHVLLVTDNLEQLPEAGIILMALLARIPQLSILATSRSRLRVAEERIYDLSTLPSDDADRLFAERAKAADPSFAPTVGDAAAISAICAKLDGLPLAIELAATRIAVLNPVDLLSRLDSRLTLLTGGPSDRPARHQALANTLSWSFDLLDPRRREVFARLGVFVGGFTLDAAEAVAAATVDDVAALIDASLIRRRDGRLTMLETVREFALEQLRLLGANEEVDTRERHATFFEQLADVSRDAPSATSLLGEDADNVRAALDWLGSRRDSVGRALNLASTVFAFWDTRLNEGRTVLESLLAAYTPRDAVRARGFVVLTSIAGSLGLVEEARAAGAAGVEIAIDLRDHHLLADLWSEIGWAHAVVGDVDGLRNAVAHELRAVSTLDREDPRRFAAELNRLWLAVWGRDLASFDRLLPDALRRAREFERRGEPWRTETGGTLDASAFLLRVEALRGEAALHRGFPAEAKVPYQKFLALFAPRGWSQLTATMLEGVALSLAGSGADEVGLRLAGAAASYYESSGFVLADGGGSWNELRRRYYGAARSRVGPQAADAHWAAGKQMAFGDAISIALDA